MAPSTTGRTPSAPELAAGLSNRESALAAAERLDAAGDPGAAVELLSEVNRRRRDPIVEQRLVGLRVRAAERLPRDRPDGPWPVPVADPFPGVSGPPEIAPHELTAEVLGGALGHHGCLLIRGLVGPEVVDRLVAATDAAFEARERWFDGAPLDDVAPAFVPIDPGPGYPALDGRRRWVRDGGAVWVADSPPALFDVLEVYRAAAIPDVLAAYLGERPALTVNKFTLRRVPHDTYPSWHQDGSFLGEGIRTVNVWISLDHCGGSSPLPALDVVPTRLGLLETGTEGALLPSEVGPGVVARVAGEAGVCRPEFRAGDALLFDEVFLHRTAISEGMRGVRHAVESWFFTPSVFPPDYVPLAI